MGPLVLLRKSVWIWTNFQVHKHIASWAGMCPGSNESAGKNKSGRITYGNKYLRAFLVEQAWAASRTKNTYLSSKYKSLVGRRGKKRAVNSSRAQDPDSRLFHH
jgi:transposase